MHQTTVRFGEDLWQALESECAHLGVSIAQYLREAALTRLVYAAGRRGDDEFELALELATGAEPHAELAAPGELELAARPTRGIRAASDRAASEGADSAALAAQGRLARQRARELRDRAAHRRQR
jgi:hypothetical protein